MFHQTGVKIIKLDYEAAKNMAKMKEWRGERPIKDWRIGFLADKVDRGTFYTPTWATGTFRDRTYRMNGQHSSVMLADLENGDFPTGMKAVVLEFACETEQDMCDLFSEFDPNRSVRSRGDIALAHASIHRSLKDIPERPLLWTTAGIAFALSKAFNARKVTTDERAALLHEYPSFVLWGSNFHHRPGFRRTGIAAAMFTCYERDSVAADQFWNWVGRQSHTDPQHVSRLLAAVYQRADASVSAHPVKPAELYAKSIYAWNAWRRNEKLTVLRYLTQAPMPTPV